MYQLLRKRLAGKKGFTLIELIVVIAVIAILAVILIPRFTGFTRSAREKSVLSDARNAQMALEALDTEGEYPTSDANAVTAVNDYLGKDLRGTLYDVGKGTNGGVSFKYYMVFSGQRYTAECIDGTLKETVSVAAVPAGGGPVGGEGEGEG
mgnify:CR=1 FL=1